MLPGKFQEGRIMSTLAYAALTTVRDQQPPDTSTTTSLPNVRSYIDAVAALIPAEVLTLHAVILSFTTETATGTNGNSITTITEPGTLWYAFFGLLILSMVLYLVPRFRARDKFDWIRVAIPPVAFIAWTMLQKSTAFDAVWPGLGAAPRTVTALFIAVILAVLATMLGKKADQKTPPKTSGG